MHGSRRSGFGSIARGGNLSRPCAASISRSQTMSERSPPKRWREEDHLDAAMAAKLVRLGAPPVGNETEELEQISRRLFSSARPVKRRRLAPRTKWVWGS